MSTDAGRVHISDDVIVRVPTQRSAYDPSCRDKEGADGKGVFVKEVDVDDEKDVRKAQKFKGKLLFWLAYQSIGVIYGDIGTSPLYVYSSTFSSEPSRDDLLGALSLIIWTLTLMVSIKYILIVLRADDEGEGGTFAVYSLLSRYAHIVRRDPREERTIKMERIKTSDVRNGNRQARTFIERSGLIKVILKIIGVFGVSLVMSDGVLTPAQSVLGAIQGLEVVHEDITKSTIVGSSCAILIVLFLIQPFGTSRLGSCFAPIVILWLVFNLSFGIYNLVHFDWTVLKAFSPYFAGSWFVRNKTDGWRSLGGILLAFTGVEALFADLGAFTRPAIQLSWLCFAYPCLLLAYIGQAAYISRNKGAYSNPFFNSVPPGMFYPSLVVAILAAIVASQTMITATFQLLSQIIKLSYFPQIKIKHTSKTFHGQIYIPWVNWLLMVGTICVTAAYSNTTKLGEAYGFCVILVTFLTTCMVSLVALIVWHLNVFLIIAGFLIFGTLDGLYLSSACTKVPDGAWFTLCLAVLLSSIFVLWRYGKENQWRAEAEDQIRPSECLTEHPDNGRVENSGLHLTTAMGGAQVANLPGIGIFFDKTGAPNGTPTVFLHFLQKFHAVPRAVIFFHIRPLSCPTVPKEERFTVSRVFARASEGTMLRDYYRVLVRHGYMDLVWRGDEGTELAEMVYENVRNFIIREGVDDERPSPSSPSSNSDETQPAPGAALSANANHSSSSSSSSDTTGPHHQPTEKKQQIIASHLSTLQAAYTSQVTLIVGKSHMRIADLRDEKCTASLVQRWCRRIVLAAFLWLRSNTGSKVSNMEVEVGKIVEVGFVKII